MRPGTAHNPLVRILAAVGAVLLLGVSLVLGAVIFLVFLGLAALAALAVALRMWWLRRRMARAGRGSQQAHRHRATARGRIIEGRYRRDD